MLVNLIEFSCSRCGRPVTAGDNWVDRQIVCPSCQEVLTVPRSAPAQPSTIPPVLSAAEPLPIRTDPVTRTPRQSRSAWPWILLGVCIVGVGVVVILGFLTMNFYKDSLAERQSSKIASEATPVPPIVAKIEPPKREAPTLAVDLATVTIPDTPVSGMLRNQPFAVETATILPKSILLRQGNGTIPDASLRFFLFLNPDEQLDGRKFIFEPGVKVRLRPHIHVSRKDGPNGGSRTEIVGSDYSLRLEFGERQGNKLPGRIYLEMAERHGTKVSGNFEATITP